MPSVPRSEPRNILLISLDDAVAPWRYKTCFGAGLQTPNLDRICAQSTAFRAAYCQAPLCAPSRASFLTGRTPHQTGVFSHDDQVFDTVDPTQMWPYLLKQSGFFCSSGGKVHHGFKPLPEPVHDTLYSDAPKHFRIDWKMPKSKPQKAFGGWKDGIATTDPADDGYFHDAHAAKSALAFLDSADPTQPFYREVGFYSPHGPFFTPARFKEMYDETAFRPPASWADGFDDPLFVRRRFRRNLNVQEHPDYWAKSVRNYFSAYSHADYHLGRVWDALQASPHARNTVVVILSDHGFHLGERNSFKKGTLWDQALNVPLIIYDPDHPQARVVDDPVGLIDVGPTVLDYVGQEAPPDWIGRSLRPVVQGDEPPNPDRVIASFHHDHASIRAGQYRMIRFSNGRTDLYDLQADPWQQTRLTASHPVFRLLQQELRQACRASGFNLPDPPAKAG